ncbi:MAG TPA: hypothetical protein GX505_06885 [Clostridiales bacterium]|nr:hypothetical protein [Clostridiales bacterium]
MQKQLDSSWDQINKHIDESPILSMLVNESSVSDIDYSRYLQYGYSKNDVAVGFELISIYKTLKKCLNK